MKNIHTLKTCLSLFIALSLLAIQPVFADVAKRNIPDTCTTQCVSPYGKILGKSPSGVEAYSNCRSECVIFEPNKKDGTYTGIKWQCVEYARRWLLVHKGAVYGDVDIAADIWNKIDHLTHVENKKKLQLASYVNGSTQAPRIGDMLIYAKAFYGTGHVAIVTDVDLKNGFVKVGEQNYNNDPWPGDYARKIDLINKNGKYWLLDGYILGWKRVKNDK
jgi:glutathionylspermidine amidase/synthetase